MKVKPIEINKGGITIIVSKKQKILLIISGVVIFILLLNLESIFHESNTYGLIALNSSDWSNVISNSHKPTLVYVGRSSCEQCEKFKPMLEKVIEENKSKVYYFDTDKNVDIKETIIKKYNIIAVPSIVVFLNNDFYIIMDSDNNEIIDQVSTLLQTH